MVCYLLKRNRMRLTILIALLINFCCYGIAQTEKANKYISLYKEVAINEMRRSGVPAAIILAQGMLESGYGESELSKKSNNHFGIKCKNDWQGEKTYFDDDEKGECFRVYKSVAESYKDHSDFLKSRSWYAFLFKLPPTDYEGWAHGLKKAGYATANDYAPKLIKIITDYNLQQFTLEGLKNSEANTTTKTDKQDSTTIPYHSEDNTETTEEDSTETSTNETRTNISKPLNQDTLNPKHPIYATDSVFTINHSKVIFSAEGTSLLAIANKYNISLSSLFAFNDMKPIELIDTFRLIFIEKKLKKGAEDNFISNNNETLYDICQLKGVQLESILQYNKGIKKDVKLSKGFIVYLRPQNKIKKGK